MKIMQTNNLIITIILFKIRYAIIPLSFQCTSYDHLHIHIEQDTKIIAPPKVVRIFNYTHRSIAIIVFSCLLWFFLSITSSVTIISSNTLPGYSCVTLSPKKGLDFFNSINSENGQFARVYEFYNDCMSRLDTAKLCINGIKPYLAVSSPTQYLGANGGCLLMLADGTLYCLTFDLTVAKSAYTQVSHGASTSLARPLPPNSTVTTASSKCICTYLALLYCLSNLRLHSTISYYRYCSQVLVLPYWCRRDI